MRSALLPLILVLGTAQVAAAQTRANPRDAALAAHRAWWRAFTVGDTARLAVLTAADLSLTLSTGESFDRNGAIAQASVRGDSTQVQLEWSEESARVFGTTAVITSRVAERVGRNESFYRYITVLRALNGGWQTVAAQSARSLVPAPAVAIDPALLAEYAGRYRVPSGAVIQVVARDSMLAITSPGGREDLLAPLGTSVFEIRSSRARFDLLRFVFERDATGRITRMTRLSPTGVMSFTRVP